METSLSYEILDYLQNVVVQGTDDVIRSQQNPFSSSSSYSATFSCSIAEQKSHSTHESLRVQQAGEEPLRKKRRMRLRTRNEKSREEKEKQRTNHIAVERNRRKQMNHYLSILKSLMPLSYSPHNGQASIIEGTIDYLKKLEQFLQSHKVRLKATKPNPLPNIFSDFFMFPQYSTTTSSSGHHHQLAAVADVEVTMMERHANIKVLTKTRPKLLFKIINEFCSLGFNTLHLNLTTSKDMSLFTFSVKVEEECELRTSSVNEVANAVHEVIRRIHKES